MQKLDTKKAIKLLALGVLIHLFTYYIPKLIPYITDVKYFETALDRRIPFLPIFMPIYLSAGLQWAYNYHVLGNGPEKKFIKYFTAEISGKIICMFFFIFIPSAIQRPQVEVKDFFTWLTNLVFLLDSPSNAFPSIHCFLSWNCMRTVLDSDYASKHMKIFSCIWTGLIVASTLLVKQHVIVDCIAGIILAELSILFGNYISKIYCRNSPKSNLT